MPQKPPRRPTDEELKAKAISRWENEGGTANGMTKQPKRPRDLNQWAKRMVEIATGQVEDREPTPEEQGKDPAAVKRGQLGGAKGGKARAEKLSPQDRRRSAQKAAQARWSRS